MEYAQRSLTLKYAVLEFVSPKRFLPVHKICSFSSFHVVTQLRFLNKLPEYVLVIQLVQDRASRLCSRSCILWIACSTLYSVVVLLCGEEKILSRVLHHRVFGKRCVSG